MLKFYVKVFRTSLFLIWFTSASSGELSCLATGLVHFYIVLLFINTDIVFIILLFINIDGLWFCIILFLCFSVLLALRLPHLGKRTSLGAFCTFVRFVVVWFCLFRLPLGVWEGLRFVIVALLGLFSQPFWGGLCVRIVGIFKYFVNPCIPLSTGYSRHIRHAYARGRKQCCKLNYYFITA